MANTLKDKSFSLAVRIVKLYQYLTQQKGEFVLSKQVLRAGTNPGAMVREAKHAESDVDYIHKLSVAQKEINETIYWLELLEETGYLTNEQFLSIYNDAIEVHKLLTSSIITKKKNIGIIKL